MTEAYLGLGSNLGDRREHLRRAIDRLDEQCVVRRISSLYETEPIACPGPEKFLNAAAHIETALSPLDLLAFLRGIETDQGRVRRVKNDPRTLDLDILFCSGAIINEDDLVVPHPRLHERGFVLIPLAEIAPDVVHPVLSAKVSELARQLPGRQQVIPIEADWWHSPEAASLP